MLTATTSGNIQSRLSREEVAHLTAQDKGEESLEWHFEIRAACILRAPLFVPVFAILVVSKKGQCAFEAR